MNGKRSWVLRSSAPITALALVGTLWLGACQRMGTHHGWHANGPLDAAEAREHAEDAAEWMLGKVDATDDQQERARLIVDRTVDGLLPLAEKHRANHQAWLAALEKPTVDRAGLEQLRVAELQLADQASKELITAMADLSEVLTPEQRAELLEMAKRKHRHFH